MTDCVGIHGIFHEIQEKSKDGNYIYRGEPNCTESDKHGGKVSSRLWRECVKHNIRDVEDFQKTRIEYAKNIRPPTHRSARYSPKFNTTVVIQTL